MCPGQREIGRAVIECRIVPARGGMTLTAIMAVVVRDVIGIRCLLILRCMTLVAIGVKDIVVVICMARRALYRKMRTCQCEVRCAVIERRIIPANGRMTLTAVVTVIGGDVIGIGGLLILGCVALVTPGIRQGEIPVGMTRLALDREVRSCEWKTRRAMVKGRRCPCRRGMTLGAIMRESARDVIGRLYCREGGLMAAVAVGWDMCELVTDMAL